MKTTLDIDDRLLERTKRLAADTGSTLRAVVEDALRARLATRPKAQQRFRFEPPTMGGLRSPAVDIADRKLLYDYIDGRE